MYNGHHSEWLLFGVGVVVTIVLALVSFSVNSVTDNLDDLRARLQYVEGRIHDVEVNLAGRRTLNDSRAAAVDERLKRLEQHERR